MDTGKLKTLTLKMRRNYTGVIRIRIRILQGEGRGRVVDACRIGLGISRRGIVGVGGMGLVRTFDEVLERW